MLIVTETGDLFRMSTLEKIYKNLYSHYGDLDWWPADTPYEVMVGAILTQNTSWNNVEKAIKQLSGKLTPENIHSMSIQELQDLIRPAGFYKQKSQYIKALTEWFMNYDCDIDIVKNRPLPELRSELLQVRGVGNETADSILLYAFGFPSFIVDAYTMRLFRRFPIETGEAYIEVKDYCEQNLSQDAGIYNRFHALIVQNGKEHCKKKMDCKGCPLEEACQKLSS